ncbi:MAG: zinc ribbon domain-containing protein [Methylococcales symbiont of Iophon sp. n. MRB-2018]|nr:MAG: zinc ribbon domain-containing protein [Methylococcales symbiont of Iophon sp. n. MRB-2018]KAF3980646.1 MAG: zinc ribbon domain-containing protein [Methylococcales symbiont of Iophon sp. n. MRB-2018]
MPIYEYQCQACGNEHEALQKMSAEPLVECPVCAKPELKKKISVAGFRLKGNGWYETDFKGGSKKKETDPAKTESNKSKKPTEHSCSSSCSH